MRENSLVVHNIFIPTKGTNSDGWKYFTSRVCDACVGTFEKQFSIRYVTQIGELIDISLNKKDQF